MLYVLSRRGIQKNVNCNYFYEIFHLLSSVFRTKNINLLCKYT